MVALAHPPLLQPKELYVAPCQKQVFHRNLETPAQIGLSVAGRLGGQVQMVCKENI